jgi:hypothetical protein
MAAAAAAGLAAALLVTDRGVQGAVLLGTPAPLAAAVGSWMVLARVHARAPARVAAAMIKLFAAKMVLFGAYVALVVRALDSGVTAFVASFTCQYILLHLVEAWCLRRLFAGGEGAGVGS